MVHVEGFSPQAIFSAGMSFSTKIIDYMLVGKPILAFGPKEVTSIQVLKNHQVALAAISQDELDEIMSDIAFNRVAYQELEEKIKKYLFENRDIADIQAGIYQRMSEVVNKQ